MKHYFLIISMLFLFNELTFGQFVIKKEAPQDSAYTIPMINVSYARQWSSADLANRFGANNNIGVSFIVKSKTKWIYGLKGSFLWGGEVQNKTILDGIKTQNDYVIDNEGRQTTIFLGQRGSSGFAVGGRFFNILAPNKNSGIVTYVGIGFLQHKISMKFKDEIVGLTDDFKKGYDRYSLGYAFNGYIGYLFLSKNRLLNFFGGFDYTYGKTKSLRKFNYDTNMPDNKVNTDVLYGIRLGWIIRLNKRQADNFYYN
ncbi:MAG: hypothetical protein ACPGSO_03800 [Vicingaceae bacterium]